MRVRWLTFVRRNWLGLLALTIAVVGVPMAWALGKNTVGSKQIKKGAVKSVDVKNEALTGVDVKNEALTGVEIQNGALTDLDVKDDALTGADLNESTLGVVPSADNVGGVQMASFSFAQPTQTASVEVLNGPGYRIRLGCPIQGIPLIVVTPAAEGDAIVATVGNAYSEGAVGTEFDVLTSTTPAESLSLTSSQLGTAQGSISVRSGATLTMIDWVGLANSQGFGTSNSCFFYGQTRRSQL